MVTHDPEEARLRGDYFTLMRAGLIFIYCFLPIMFGFIALALYLIVEAYKRMQFVGISSRIWGETGNIVIVSIAVTFIVFYAIYQFPMLPAPFMVAPPLFLMIIHYRLCNL